MSRTQGERVSMAQKYNFQFSIRQCRPSDQHEVISLLYNGILEHVYPAFFKAMRHPDHVGITLSMSMAGYVLGGSSYFQALLFGSAWAGLIYYCCHEIYQDYLMSRMSTDMADIVANYLENPDNGFWVAEADINGQTKMVGMVAVVGKMAEEEGEKFDDWNGGVMQAESEFAEDAGDERYGEMIHTIVKFPWRRKNLGSQLTQTALDFCKERGYTHLLVNVSSPQTAAITLYQKLGFIQTACHSNIHANWWLSKLARITIIRMEKLI